ncbi:MAG: SatD family protein [Acidimicrobiales bacterium]
MAAIHECTVPGVGPGYAAVLIDIVDSRRHGDRAQLQAIVAAAAAEVNRHIIALDPLTATVGDELQATYADALLAIRGAAELRLELTGVVEIRAGIGWGDIVMHDPDRTPFGQDGPAWWAARAALDDVASSTARSGYAARLGIGFADTPTPNTPTPNTGTRPGSRSSADPLPPPAPFSIDAAVVLRSHLALLDRALATVDPTEARIVLGDLHGRSNEELAAELDLGPSAVSQRRGRNHLRELVAALRVIGTGP